MNAMVTIRECIAEAGRRLGCTPEQIKDANHYADANNPDCINASNLPLIPEGKTKEEVVQMLIATIRWARDNPEAALAESQKRHAAKARRATKN